MRRFTYALEPSAREPVGRLDQEDVAGPSEDHPGLATRTEITLKWQEIATLLLPHEKEGRAWTVLPSYYGIAAEGVGAEIRIIDGK